MCGTALAAPELITLHKSIVNMNWYADDGEASWNNGLSPDLSTARFYSVGLLVKDENAVNDTEGEMTITNGGYSFWDNDKMNDVTRSGSHTFKLVTTKTSTRQERDARFLLPAEIEASFKGFAPVNNLTNFVNFNYSADTELKGASVVFTVPNGSGITATVSSNLMSTAEQLNKFVPYIEYVRENGTGDTTNLRWRLVKPNDISTAVSPDKDLKFEIVGLYTKNDSPSKIDDVTELGVKVCQTISIAAGADASGDITFSTKYNKGSFALTVVRWYYDEEPNTQYQWLFYNYKTNTAADTHLGINYNISAKMVDGKPDYSYAKYSGLGIEVGNLNQILDAGFMSNQMTFTVPGVYNIINPYNGEVIKTVSESESDTFYLLPVNPQGYQMEYTVQMRDGDDSRVPVFWDETGKGLNGKTIKWNFPEHPDFSGEETVPEYKSVEEQLASFFPYFELTSEDGKFTRLQCRLVQSGDLETVYEADGYYQWYLMVDGFYEDGTSSYWYETDAKFKVNADAGLTKVTSADWVFDNPIPIGMGNRVWITLSFIKDPRNPNGPGSVNYCWVFDDYPPQGNVQTVENLATGVEESAINMLSEDISELNYIKVDDILEAANADGEVLEMISEDSGDLLGRLNTVSADADGWYIMKLDIPDELYDNLQGVSADELVIYSSSSDQETETESESSIARVFNSSRMRIKTAASSNISSNNLKILSMSGGKLDGDSDTREVLIAGYLKAGATKMYLGAKNSSSSSTEPEKPNASEIKNAIESNDLIINALENAASSDAALSLIDILNALGEDGMIAYGINDLDDADFGNEETGFRFVLLSLDEDSVSSGDIVYVNLLSGDSFSDAKNNINSTNGYFVLNLVSMDKISWLLIDTQNLKQLSNASPAASDSKLDITSRKYVTLARVLAQNDAQNIFKASALKFKASAVTDGMSAYASNGAVLLNPNAAKTDTDPNPNPDTDPDGEDEIINQDNVSSHGSSSGCNNLKFNILSLLALALALNFARKHN